MAEIKDNKEFVYKAAGGTLLMICSLTAALISRTGRGGLWALLIFVVGLILGGFIAFVLPEMRKTGRVLIPFIHSRNKVTIKHHGNVVETKGGISAIFCINKITKMPLNRWIDFISNTVPSKKNGAVVSLLELEGLQEELSLNNDDLKNKMNRELSRRRRVLMYLRWEFYEKRLNDVHGRVQFIIFNGDRGIISRIPWGSNRSGIESEPGQFQDILSAMMGVIRK